MVGGYEVYKDTIGQFTGLKDAKGKDIYEGDILKDSDGQIYLVWYSEDYTSYMVEILNPENNMIDNFCGYYKSCSLEIIGNKFDNPELLKGE